MQKVLQDCAVDFDGALRRNAARVYRLVYARAHRKEDAEDLFQEVFVRYARSAPAFDSEEHEKAWFLRVSINCINSFYKKAEHRRAVSVEQAPKGRPRRRTISSFCSWRCPRNIAWRCIFFTANA